MGAPKYTSRLSIPYPDERDETWWANEDGVGARMDKLDELICSTIENQTLLKHDVSTGSFTYVDPNMTTTGDVVIASASGGTITFANGISLAMADYDWLYFQIAARPLVGSETGTLLAAASVPPDPRNVIIGRRQGAKFLWVRQTLQ